MKKIKKILIFSFIGLFSAVLFFAIPQVKTKAKIVGDTEYLIMTTGDDEIIYGSNQYFPVVYYNQYNYSTLEDFYYYMDYYNLNKINIFVPVKNTMYFYNEYTDTFKFLSHDIREFDLIIETIEFNGFSHNLFNLRLYGDNKIDLGVFNIYNISGNQWLVSPITLLLSSIWFQISDINSYYDGFMDGRISTLQDGYEAAFLAGKEEGYWEAYFANYQNAFDEGYAEAYDLAYDNGYDEGYNLGYMVGRDYGISMASDNTFYGIISQIFMGLGSFLAIELLPNITFGAIFAVPLVFGIIFFIIGKRGGKND